METKDNKLQEFLDTISLTTSGYSDDNYGAVPPITMSTMNGTLDPISISAGAITGGTYSNTVLTTNGTSGLNWTTGAFSISQAPNPMTVDSSGTISLKGDNADIKVNGWSLKDAINRIEERLNLLNPNQDLEKEWEDLRSLGKQYRELEQHIKDKMATWDRLKAMPPPVVS
jgi:hypothetical protein